MGLDMYLNKEIYISEYDKNKDLIDQIYNLLEVKDESNNYKHLEITLPAIYWRKANQIHSWFVQNVQEGVDECQESEVSIEDLKRLLDTVNKQLENKEEIILKPQSGFFFGNTDIDEDYWQDLEETKKQVEREISFYDSEKEKGRIWSFQYRASW